MDTKIVFFKARDGIALAGILFTPKKPASSAMLYLHGLGGNFYSKSILAVGKEACAKGMAFFAMQQRGSHIADELGYEGKKASILSGAAFEQFEDSQYDIYGALSLLKKLGFRKVILIGKSTGCQKSIYFLYKNSKKPIAKMVKGLVLLSPVDDRNYDIKNHQKSHKNFHKNILIANRLVSKDSNAIMPKKLLPKDQWPISALRFLSTAEEKSIEGKLLDYKRDLAEFKSIKIPIIAIFGSNDEYMKGVISIGLAAARLKENKFTKKVIVIKGAGHSLYSKKNFPAKKVVNEAKAFLI
ncbi:MAG: alpha/beta fold hydrolase [Candidatus Micrarchaeia archaeon]